MFPGGDDLRRGWALPARPAGIARAGGPRAWPRARPNGGVTIARATPPRLTPMRSGPIIFPQGARPSAAHNHEIHPQEAILMIRRRTFVSSLLAAPAIWSVRDAFAQTPRDTLVLAKQIDDIISLDPHESFEFSGNETDSNIYEKLITTPNASPQRIVGELAESWSA